jgi:hypothetical protein
MSAIRPQPRLQRQVDHTAKASIRTKRLKLADQTPNVEEVLNDPTSGSGQRARRAT